MSPAVNVAASATTEALSRKRASNRQDRMAKRASLRSRQARVKAGSFGRAKPARYRATLGANASEPAHESRR